MRTACSCVAGEGCALTYVWRGVVLTVLAVRHRLLESADLTNLALQYVTRHVSMHVPLALTGRVCLCPQSVFQCSCRFVSDPCILRLVDVFWGKHQGKLPRVRRAAGTWAKLLASCPSVHLRGHGCGVVLVHPGHDRGYVSSARVGCVRRRCSSLCIHPQVCWCPSL